MNEIEVHLADAEATVQLGRALAGLVRRGDLIVLTGGLGAGKTTLTQGLGAALGVRGQVASPTFVIAREHAPGGDGPGLVHVDAYRLDGLAELDALDLDSALEDVVTVVEWGAGLVEDLSADRLEIEIVRARGEAADDGRSVRVRAVGQRWTDVDLTALRGDGLRLQA